MAVIAAPRDRAGPGSRAPIAVHVVRGDGATTTTATLRALDGVRVVHSPRHADLLVIAGAVPDTAVPALHHVHDQLLPPRATVWLVPGARPEVAPTFADATVVGPQADIGTALTAARDELDDGRRPSSPDRLPPGHPVPWQGTGPYGTGGEGMMGGRPYGRPLAMTADDIRDGLALDALPVELGPFLPWSPPGTSVSCTLQGDVIQSAELTRWTAATRWYGATSPPDDDRATIALARLSDLLALAGLEALARRAARLLHRAPGDRVAHVRRLARLLRRTRALDGLTAGAAVLDDRLDHPLAGTDARTRWRRWVATACGDDTSSLPEPPLELETLSAALTQLEWGDAVTLLATVPIEEGDVAVGASA